MIAYLDTRTFDHIYKKIGCTGADVANLRKAIYGRQLSIPLSIHTLEEILLVGKARPELLVAQIKLTLSLASFRRLVKPCDQLLADDIRSYAARGAADRPYLGADIQNIISDGIGELIETDGEDRDEDMIAALQETRRRKERFVAELTGIHQAASSAAEPFEPQTTFESFFDRTAAHLTEAFADRAGVLDACRTRGLNGLTDLKSVRMAVGLATSFLFGHQFEGWPPNLASSPDLLHAVSAAAVAEIFVTDDQRLRAALARVPFDGLEVLDLPTFLQRLN